MIVQNEFLKKIKDFGLNSYEAKIWTALLSRGVSTAGELSDIANVPRSRSYDVLESLEKKGFIIMKIGKPIKYIAVPPEEVLERVKKKVEEESQAHVKSLESLKDSNIISELNLLHKEGVDLIEPTDITASLKGRDNLYSHLDLMIKTAEDTIIIMTTEDGLVRKADYLKKQLKKASERGVKVRIAAPITEKTKSAVEAISAYAEIRHTNSKARFCIVDGEEITFMLLDDESTHPMYDVGVWVNTPFFSTALTELFELAWNAMKVVA
jgi:HTH-type transcriptional regulator, sugar sensing transcriptional regulator